MSASLPQNDWQQTALFELTLSLEASPAKTLASMEVSQESQMAPEAGCGANALALLASYDPISQSLRTSQTCWLAHLNNQADGLAEYSQTWPQSGMMRNGKIYQRRPWALPIAESVSGLLPTPVKFDGVRFIYTIRTDAARRIRLGYPFSWHHVASLLQPCEIVWANPLYSIAMMGFPTDWLNLEPAETP
jgi:hypothetical protein